MAPVVRELQKQGDYIRSWVCVTAQHRDMLDQVLDLFGIVPDIDLDLMQPGQHPSLVAARVLTALDPVLEDLQPDWLLVQGDTTTVMAAAIAAHHRQVKVGHVEAGLRTGDRANPFPEEMNRVVTDHIADLHFAPTTRACQNLLREGIPRSSIHVTGNTVIDALLWVAAQPATPEINGLFDRLGLPKNAEGSNRPRGRQIDQPSDQATNRPPDQLTNRPTDQPDQATTRPTDQPTTRPGDQAANRPPDQLTNRPTDQPDQVTTRPTDQPTNRHPLTRSSHLILVTAHRRESFGKPLRDICQALKDIAQRPDVRIVYPVHRNPNVWYPVHGQLGNVPRIHLIPPVDYLTLVHLMKRSTIILTDSGGIQEEAPSLGVPVLVLRRTTERPEVVEAGAAHVVGTDPIVIAEAVHQLLDDPEVYSRMSQVVNPYGDGHAAEHIVRALRESRFKV
jgi:UDP-N-acetylglucosamine 2-epimerase